MYDIFEEFLNRVSKKVYRFSEKLIPRVPVALSFVHEWIFVRFFSSIWQVRSSRVTLRAENCIFCFVPCTLLALLEICWHWMVHSTLKKTSGHSAKSSTKLLVRFELVLARWKIFSLQWSFEFAILFVMDIKNLTFLSCDHRCMMGLRWSLLFRFLLLFPPRYPCPSDRLRSWITENRC